MTRVGEILGTPLYMSPEQAEAKPADHRSDIYSYGVIVYEMATGQAPFGGESTMQVMYQHVTQAPKDPKLVNPEVPDYLSAVILKCLQKRPHQAVPSSAGDSPRSGIRHGAEACSTASHRRDGLSEMAHCYDRCDTCAAGCEPAHQPHTRRGAGTVIHFHQKTRGSIQCER